MFVDRSTFEAAIAAGAFLEHAEFLGELYGTPLPDPPPGRDLLLEIDRQGAEQVRRLHPDAVVILLVPPSPEVQSERLRRRGDAPDAVETRLRTGADEVAGLRRIADHEVVNESIDQAVAEVAGILAAHRQADRRVLDGDPSGGP